MTSQKIIISITTLCALLLISGCNQRQIAPTPTDSYAKIEALTKRVETLEQLIGRAPYFPQIPKEEFPEATIDEYQLLVTHLGGPGSKFYQLMAGSVEPATGGEMEEYGYKYGAQNLGSVFFNSATNILYLGCRKNYEATSAKSWTGNDPIDMGLGDLYGIEIQEQKQINSLMVVCKKKVGL